MSRWTYRDALFKLYEEREQLTARLGLVERAIEKIAVLDCTPWWRRLIMRLRVKWEMIG